MKKILNIFLMIVAVAILAFLPALAQMLTAEDGAGNGTLSIIWVMFPAWVYLGGAITMLTLAVKYMSGGSLSKPFTLMGFGVLIDSLAQILSSLMLINLIPAIGI